MHYALCITHYALRITHYSLLITHYKYPLMGGDGWEYTNKEVDDRKQQGGRDSRALLRRSKSGGMVESEQGSVFRGESRGDGSPFWGPP